jgi:hypothetical protein
MTVDELNHIQRRVEDGLSLSDQECAALVAEVWRLKAANSGKLIEAATAREDANTAEKALSEALGDNELLRQEILQLKALDSLSRCDLERRWSNCAIRQKKAAQAKQSSASHDPSDLVGRPRSTRI